MNRTAVIPCAGRGTRMGRLAFDTPKELLPFGEKPVLSHVIEELAHGGCTEIVIILRKGKELIRDHVLRAFGHLRFVFVDQPEPLGLGHAYYQLKGRLTQPFLAALPDHVVRGPVVRQMWEAHDAMHSQHPVPFILKSQVTVSEEEARLSTGKRPGDDILIRNTGRVIYPPELFEFIDPDERNPASGELDERIPEAHFERAHPIRCLSMNATVWDIGTSEGYFFYLNRLANLTD